MIEGIIDPGDNSSKSELAADDLLDILYLFRFFRADCNIQISDYKNEIKSI